MDKDTLYYDMEQAVAQARSTSLRSSMESQRRSTQMLHYLKCAATDEDDTGFYFLYTEGDVLSVHFFSQNTSKTTYTWRIEAAATNAHIIYFGSLSPTWRTRSWESIMLGHHCLHCSGRQKYCVVMPAWNPLCDKGMFREGMICGTQKTLVLLTF
ncbi:hypothetical protein MUK42_06040 [Musa troglodytarum]|uniref:Uncharacterized protein n=1 Tax=Musa troglodytarum TaxID=320322 RepID=A0A9E7GPS4_9LILI|nr:hypothetical protein MUK42_06040 [Musa troglodytarum]